MLFLPLATRELRVRARQWATYRNRTFGALGGVLLVVGMLVLAELFGAWQAIGSAAFTALSTLAFVYCLVEGLRNTVDCLSREKREGTLGLLFLTELTGVEILAGKFAANSLHCLFNLLAIFPALAVPFVVGGVSAGDFWRTVLTLLLTLWFALSTGLLVSAVGYDARRVWGAGLLVAGAVLVLPPVLDLAIAGGRAANFHPALSLASPAYAFAAARDNWLRPSGGFWGAMAVIAFESVAALAVCAWLMARLWRTEPAHSTAPQAAVPGLSALINILSKSAADAKELELNPAAWLLARGRKLRPIGWAALAAIFLLVLPLWIAFASNRVVAGVAAGGFYLLHWGFRIWLANVACDTAARARESGLLEMMLVSPLPARAMFEGCVAAVKRAFLAPFIALAVTEVILLVIYERQQPPSSFDLNFLFVIGALAILLADLLALTHVGLWHGLVLRQPARAFSRTVFYVLALPLIAVVIVPVLLLFCGGLTVPFWFIAKSAIFVNVYREKLKLRFHEVLTEPGKEEDERPGWWPFGRSRKNRPANPPPLPGPPPIIRPR